MAVIFIFSWLILLVFAVRLIFNGWSAASDLSANQYDEGTRYVTRIQHPEMAEVKPGDELMVVNFKKSPSEDPLLRSLEDRIDELKNDDDDDDGGIVSRA